MPMTRAAASTRQWRALPLAAALSAALALSCNADAAMLGHTRIVSAAGQPLRIDVPIVRLSAQELSTLKVTLAPAAAWTRAGLVPPAELSSLRVGVDDGPQPGMRIVHITSGQVFDRPVADLLLEVQTASGRQQYQISVLAPLPRSTAAAGGAGKAADGSRVGMPGKGRAVQAAPVRIHVRDGNYLFELARSHAVPGVTVYQMMVGLLRANPQAFIHANMNLVKAGATLRVPDVSVLTSVSDREARRIFEEQALEFARYRQRLAAAGMAAAPDEAADRGKVTAGAASGGSLPAASPRNRLKLSSGAADDARADDRVAMRKGITDSKHRISELEGNIGALGQALHGQQGGNAAGGAGGAGAPAAGTAGGGALLASAAASGVAGAGASGIGGARSPSGSARDGSGMSAGTAAAAQDGGQGNTASGGAMRAQPGVPQSGLSQSGVSQSGQAANNGADAAAQQGQAGQAGAAGHPGAGAQPGQAAASMGQSGQAGQSGQTGQTGQSSQAAQGSANGAAGNSSGAASSGPGAAGAPGSASSGSAGAAGTAGAAPSGGQAGGAADAGKAGSAAQQASNKEELSVSWIQEHMLGIITGLLALIVLIIAWLLRRANMARDDDGDDHPSAITEAMVQEKLDKINLDLSQPPTDEQPAAKT